MSKMMDLDWLSKVTDTYERKARLYPALLVLVPPVVLAICSYGVTPARNDGLIGLLVTFGVIYLLTSMARELGKRLEDGLFEAWGGKPTTQLLRHRDGRIDQVTKARYHDFLGKQLGKNFPTAIDEESNPTSADDIYQAGAKWLLDKTRDTKKFNLLFKENVAYGFCRNCLGLRPIAVVVASLSVAFLLTAQNIISKNGIDLNMLAGASKGTWLSLATSLAMLFIWIFFFTGRTVKTVAFAYSDMLLRTCDALPKKRPAASTP